MNLTTKHTFISRFGSVVLIGLAVLAQLMTAVVAHAASSHVELVLQLYG